MKKTTFIIILLYVLTVWSAIGCSPSSLDYTPAVTVKAVPKEIPNLNSIVDFGNGVFYFPYVGGDFGRAFSAWRATHPKWVIISIAPDDTESYGYTRGYFVIANPDL